jgi:hypothetical protein
MDPAQEAQALADYAAAGIKLHAAGAIYFPSADESDIRGKFEYCKRAGIGTIVAGDPTPESLKWIEKYVKEYDIKIAIHNHGPEDKFFPSPFDVLKVSALTWATPSAPTPMWWRRSTPPASDSTTCM